MVPFRIILNAFGVLCVFCCCCCCCNMSLWDYLLHVTITTLLLLCPITISLLPSDIACSKTWFFFSFLIVHKVYISDGKISGKISTFMVFLMENVGRENFQGDWKCKFLFSCFVSAVVEKTFTFKANISNQPLRYLTFILPAVFWGLIFMCTNLQS